MANQKKLAIKAIEQLFNSQVQPVQNTDLAQYILSHSFGGGSDLGLAAKQGAETEEPSLLSKSFDLLSTGLYGTVNVVNDAINAAKSEPVYSAKSAEGNPLKGLVNIGDITGKILGSIGKNTLGTIARGGESSADVFSSLTGLDKAPIIGGLENKVESGLGNVADKLTPRMMSSEVLDKQFGVHNKLGKYGGGFASDVALDPITYVPGLDILSFIKKAKNAKLASQGFREIAPEVLDNAAATGTKPGSSSVLVKPNIPNIITPPTSEMALGKNLIPQINPTQLIRSIRSSTDILPNPVPVAEQFNLGSPEIANAILSGDSEAMKSARRIDNAKRAAEIRWGRNPEKLDTAVMGPEEKAAFSDFMRDRKMAKKGVVSDGKGTISNTAATNVIEDIKNGITPRFGPQPLGAEGAAAERAIKVAEQTSKNLDKPARKGISNKILTPEDQTNLYNSVRNEAARMVNEQFAARPKRVLNPKQQAAADSIKIWAKDTGKKLDKAAVDKELAAQVARKTINKGDAKTISKEFFPPEPIKNFAVTRIGAKAVDELAQKMHRSAEDHLVSQGIRPVYHNGMGVRLSEVLADAGVSGSQSAKYSKEIMDAFVTKDPSKLTDPLVKEAVTKALARRSLSMSDMLSNLSEKTLQMKQGILDDYHHPVAQKILGTLPKQASNAAQSIGATSVEGKAMADHIKNLIDSTRLPEELMMDRIGRDTAEALVNGTSTLEQRAHASQVINRMLDETPATMAKDTTGNKVISGWFSLLSTWKGIPEETKRFSQDAFMHAEVNAAGTAKYFHNLTKTFTKDELQRGFNLAKQPESLRLISEGLEKDPQVLAAASIFKDYFTQALGGTGFDSLKDLADITAVKSSMIMTDVNKYLKSGGSKFKFIDWSKGKFKAGTTEIPRDYSRKGVGWMHSWENYSGEAPLSFMYDMHLALNKTMAEYATFDDFARHFGARVGDAHFQENIHKAIIPTPRLAGYKFHPEIQQDMLRLIKQMEQGAWMPTSSMMRNIVKATRVWKSSVTIYRPAFHERNMIGDAFNTWLAGYNDPRIYTKAARILKTQKARYADAFRGKDLEELQKLINTGALDKMSLLKPEDKLGHLVIKKGGIKLDGEQLWSSSYRRGLYLSYNKIADIFGQTPMGAMFGTTPENSALRRMVAPFGGHAHQAAANITEYREHYVRLAHYIGAVEKRLPKRGGVTQEQLNKIYDDAAHEVRKYHPDGSDLSQFEQKVRVMIPFYSWTRKEIPLLVQAMVERPAKLVAMPRAQRVLAGISGIDVNEDQGMLDPYPNSQLFPDWIRASGIGPIGDPESDNAVARFWSKFGATTIGPSGPEGFTIINPSNPYNDTITQLMGFGGPHETLRGVVNSMNPGIQIPAQLWANQTFSGAPITGSGGEGLSTYFGKQIPQYSEFSRLSGIGRNDNPTLQNKATQNILNFLFAAGILGTGPYQKSAEFEAKDRARNASSK